MNPDDPTWKAQYNTPIPPERQRDFDQWVAKQHTLTGKDPRADMQDYDVQGYFLSQGANDERGHGPDTFKKPNHPTFSDESMYSGKAGNVGGSWIPSGQHSVYQASPTNMKFRSKDELNRYFSEVEPGDLVTSPPSTPLPPALRSRYGK